jgi:tripartite-type tricarboxylate transporter receptor subunit TctC
LGLAPDIPTVDEAGLPGLYVAVWHAIWVSKGTPQDFVGQLNLAIVSALANEETRRRFADIRQEILPRSQQAPEALAAYHRAEIEKWWPTLKRRTSKAIDDALRLQQSCITVRAP